MGRKIQAELTNMCMVCRGDQVLVQRRSPEYGWPGITFPGGHVEPGESVTQSVVREVFEETGLRLRHPRLCGVKNWIEDDGEVFWADRDGLPGMNLSSGMEETFRVFFEEELSELCYCREDPENDWRIVLE